jgi:hypothetical protein
MKDFIDIAKRMTEDGVTWMEIILISFFMVGVILISFTVIAGIISVIVELTKSIIIAINRAKKNDY